MTMARLSIRPRPRLFLFAAAAAALALAAASAQPRATLKPGAARPHAELSDAALVRLMGAAPDDYERERALVVKNQLPPGFWELEPKAAALALAELNRKEDHRRRFRLAINDRDGSAPPESGSVALTNASSRCYVASDAHHYLRFSPGDSFLARAGTSSGGAVFYNVVSDRQVIELRQHALPYERARHLAATLWWLARVSSQSRDNTHDLGDFISSTADGSAGIILRDGQGALLMQKSATRWAAEVSERWSGAFDDDTFVNLATWLVSRAFVERLGDAWERGGPPPPDLDFRRAPEDALYSPEQLRHLTVLADRFLHLAAENPPRLSPALAAVAANAVGELSLIDSKPALLRLLATLPPATATPPADDPLLPRGVDWQSLLRDRVVESLRQLETSQDAAELERWAEERGPGSQWALRRIAAFDPPRYARLLESWIVQARQREGAQLFEQLARVSPERATELARQLPKATRRAIVPPSFIRQLVGEDADAATAQLIEIVFDPQSGWSQRREAILALVPPEAPLRYTDARIDAALLRVLEPELGDQNLNFTRAEAVRALAARGRVEHFDRIVEVFRDEKDMFIRDQLLGPLVVFSQAAPEQLKPRLAALLAPQLRETNFSMNSLLWAIWAADLRSLAPSIERLATTSPDAVEDRRGRTSGGEVAPVTGRFHLARKINQLWGERDPLTRARLLAAFALSSPYDFESETNPDRRHRLHAAFTQAVQSLSPPQLETLQATLRHLAAIKGEHVDAGTHQALVDRLRTLITTTR
jgi:hypothetical protein